MRFLIFGTGDYYNRYKKWFQQQEIVALLDNSVQKQHTFLDGAEILSPVDGIRLEYDFVVILSFYVKQMKEQLVGLGVDEKCIFHFYDLRRLFPERIGKRSVQYFLNARQIIEENNTLKIKILLMSNDLTLGGPAIALFHAAMVLKQQGCEVIYCSMIDGLLREKLIENRIPTIIDENLQLATMRETGWVRSFSLLICNTLNFHVFLSERDLSIPVIWWLHDSGFFYDGVNRSVIEKISMDNLKAVSVGPVPADAVGEFLPNLECGELLYGVADMENIGAVYQDSKITRFITIGFLEDRKGQDILLQAIQDLDDDIRECSRFYIVGHNETLFGERICSESANFNEVILTGSVGREKIHELLDSADVLICPSRQDPMPTVAAEAMMHSAPCILSDATGTAAYIRDGEDGFIFECGNVHALAGKIEWCVRNKDKLEIMGKRARVLYENYFSMQAFEKQFLKVVHEALPSL